MESRVDGGEVSSAVEANEAEEREVTVLESATCPPGADGAVWPPLDRASMVVGLPRRTASSRASRLSRARIGLTSGELGLTESEK